MFYVFILFLRLGSSCRFPVIWRNADSCDHNVMLVALSMLILRFGLQKNFANPSKDDSL